MKKKIPSVSTVSIIFAFLYFVFFYLRITYVPTSGWDITAVIYGYICLFFLYASVILAPFSAYKLLKKTAMNIGFKILIILVILSPLICRVALNLNNSNSKKQLAQEMIDIKMQEFDSMDLVADFTKHGLGIYKTDRANGSLFFHDEAFTYDEFYEVLEYNKFIGAGYSAYYVPLRLEHYVNRGYDKLSEYIIYDTGEDYKFVYFSWGSVDSSGKALNECWGIAKDILIDGNLQKGAEIYGIQPFTVLYTNKNFETSKNNYINKIKQLPMIVKEAPIWQ